MTGTRGNDESSLALAAAAGSAPIGVGSTGTQEPAIRIPRVNQAFFPRLFISTSTFLDDDSNFVSGDDFIGGAERDGTHGV